MNNSWQIFDNWDYISRNIFPTYNWSIFEEMSLSLTSIYNLKISELNTFLEQWNSKLILFGGDPSNYDWNKFRPLRLSREEDWSDWLIYLISESRTGYFPKYLLSHENDSIDDYSQPLISDREISSSGYRADIIIQWKNFKYSHIEVKIGDESLEKTYGTAEKMQKRYMADPKDWNDYILLLESQVMNWIQISENHDYYIHYIIWDDVALSLRKSILHSDEPITWKVWAFSFLGAIEQRLLHLKNNFQKSEIKNINTKILLFKEGLKNGK